MLQNEAGINSKIFISFSKLLDYGNVINLPLGVAGKSWENHTIWKVPGKTCLSLPIGKMVMIILSLTVENEFYFNIGRGEVGKLCDFNKLISFVQLIQHQLCCIYLREIGQKVRDGEIL